MSLPLDRQRREFQVASRTDARTSYLFAAALHPALPSTVQRGARKLPRQQAARKGLTVPHYREGSGSWGEAQRRGRLSGRTDRRGRSRGTATRRRAVETLVGLEVRDVVVSVHVLDVEELGRGPL